MPIIKLKSKKPVDGFPNGELTLKCGFGESLANVMDNFNNYRSPENQVTSLYTIYGKLLPNTLWNIKVKEDLTLFINI